MKTLKSPTFHAQPARFRDVCDGMVQYNVNFQNRVIAVLYETRYGEYEEYFSTIHCELYILHNGY